MHHLSARPALLSLLTFALLLSGCEANGKRNTIDVPVVGVNYTEHEYSIQIHDPEGQQGSVSSGELTPFSAGGQMCCYALPEQWHPGLKWKILGLKAVVEDGRWVRDDITETIVNVPRYEKNGLGTIWLLQLPDTKVEALNSLVGPEHEVWEGKTKGWPVPPLSYRTMKWTSEIKKTKDSVNFYKKLVLEINADELTAAKEFWDPMKTKDEKTNIEFNGYDDKNFIEYLKRSFLESLYFYENKLKGLEEARPK